MIVTANGSLFPHAGAATSVILTSQGQLYAVAPVIAAAGGQTLLGAATLSGSADVATSSGVMSPATAALSGSGTASAAGVASSVFLRLWFGPASAPGKIEVNGLESLLACERAEKASQLLASGETDPHGSGWASDVQRAYFSTRTFPFKLIRMNPDDFSYTVYTAAAGENNADALAIVGTTVYVVFDHHNQIETAVRGFETSSSPPVPSCFYDLGDYGSGNSIDTDGTYLYIGTKDRYVVKVEIGNWTNVTAVQLSDPNPIEDEGQIVHAIRYHDGKVFATRAGAPYLHRLDAAGLDNEVYQQIGDANMIIHDDLALAGGYVWVPFGSTWALGATARGVVKVSDSDLSSYTTILPRGTPASMNCWGCFEEPGGGYVWLCWENNALSRIKASDSTVQQIWLGDAETKLNEIVFCGGVDKVLVTNWTVNPMTVYRLLNLVMDAEAERGEGGSARSYWLPLRLFAQSTPLGTIDTLRFFSDGENGFGANIDLKGNTATGYTEPSGTPGVSGDELNPTNYPTLAGAVEDVFGWTSVIPKTVPGSGGAAGDVGDFVVLQMIYGLGSPPGPTAVETLRLGYLEAGLQREQAGAFYGDVKVDAAAYLSGAGAMTGSASVTRGAVAELVGAGAATAIAALTIVAVAALSGSGTASASAGVIRPAATAVSGVGTATAAAGITLPASAVLAGAGAANATGVRTMPGQSAPAGAGALSVLGLATRNTAAAISAEGTMAAAGRVTRSASASVDGEGTLTVVGLVTRSTAAALASQGTLAAVGGRTLRGAVAVAGAGGLSSIGALLLPAASALAGDGTLAVQGEVGTERVGRADLSGAGTVVAYGTQVVACKATVGGQGTVSPGGHVTRSAAVGLSGSGAALASAQRGAIGQIALSGTSTATAAGVRTVRAAAPLSAEGTLAAQGESAGEALGRADLSAVGSVTAKGMQLHAGAASVGGAGSLIAAAQVTRATAASPDGAGALTVVAALTRRGAATIAGSGTTSCRGVATLPAACAGSGEGALAAQGEVGSERLGRADLSAAGALVAYGTQVHRAAVNIGGEGSLASSAKVTRTASAAPSGSGSLTASGLATRSGTVAVGGQGALTVAGVRTARAAVGLEGAGALAAQAEVGGEALGRADLTGAGAVGAAGLRTVRAAAALAGAGTAAAAGVLLRFLTPDNVESFCGEDVGAEASKSIDEDTDAYWRHSATEYHWIIYDLATEQDVFKIRIYQSAVAAERWGGG